MGFRDDRLREDPYGGHYFKLEISGAHVGHLVEVSGLKTSAQVFELEEGGVNGHAHKRPGQSKWDNIVLRYATSSSKFLQRWRDQFLRNPVSGDNWRSGAIIMMNPHGDPVRRFDFVRAWPVSWEAPRLDASASELGIESLEIAHEGITVS